MKFITVILSLLILFVTPFSVKASQKIEIVTEKILKSEKDILGGNQIKMSSVTDATKEHQGAIEIAITKNPGLSCSGGNKLRIKFNSPLLIASTWCYLPENNQAAFGISGLSIELYMRMYFRGDETESNREAIFDAQTFLFSRTLEQINIVLPKFCKHEGVYITDSDINKNFMEFTLVARCDNYKF